MNYKDYGVLSNEVEIVFFTIDGSLKDKQTDEGYRVVFLSTRDEIELVKSTHKWDTVYVETSAEAEKILRLIKIYRKMDSTPSIRNGAWAIELTLISSFAEKNNQREMFEDLMLNVLAEEIKFMDEKQWSIDDLITTPLKTIFDKIPVLQRKILIAGLEHLTAKAKVMKEFEINKNWQGTPLLAIYNFLKEEYKND